MHRFYHRYLARWKDALRGRLARRMIISTILFSGLIALLITVAQLLIEYRRDVQAIDDRFILIEQSYLPSIVDSVWVADRDRMGTLLAGIVRLPDFASAEISYKGSILSRAGSGSHLKPEEVLVRRWPLNYNYRDAVRPIGELQIAADLGSARARIVDRAGFVIGSNFVKTLLVALFLFFLVQYQMTRHLEKVSRYAINLRPENMEKPLVLERSPDQKPDELTDLVTSLNQMREQLRVTYGQMLELNQSLERRVLERTAELSLEVGMRRQNELALLRSEGQLRAVLDVALIGIIVIDENGTIEVINPAARELFGYSSSEILGRNVKVLMPHEYSQHHDGYLQRYRETGKRQVVGGQRDVAGLRKDGSEFPLRLSVSESIGGGRLFIGTVQDLTERRTFEAALIQAKLTAEQANQAKSDFLSRMSHELRTPLNSVLGYAQLLLTDRREPLTKAQQESVDSIVMGGRHLLELVNDVLDLARVEANRLELKSARVDVAMLTSNCLRTVAPLAQERNVQLHLPENTASLWGMADETRLRQAILNLLSNAINYNKPEGHVFVTLHCEEGWIRLEVRDTGIGFDAAQAGKLFQPFTRLHKGLAVAGNGIGLALTKHLMEIMGGCITATGEPGVGASFSLYVPLTDA